MGAFEILFNIFFVLAIIWVIIQIFLNLTFLVLFFGSLTLILWIIKKIKKIIEKRKEKCLYE